MPRLEKKLVVVAEVPVAEVKARFEILASPIDPPPTLKFSV